MGLGVWVCGGSGGLKYTNANRAKVKNRQPINAPRGVNATPPRDMYFKGALFINTLRGIVNDDTKWRAWLSRFYQRFKYQTIMTEDIVAGQKVVAGESIRSFSTHPPLTR